MLAASKQDFARLTLGMFASSFPAYPLDDDVRRAGRVARRQGRRHRGQGRGRLRGPALHRHQDAPAADAQLDGQGADDASRARCGGPGGGGHDHHRRRPDGRRRRRRAARRPEKHDARGAGEDDERSSRRRRRKPTPSAGWSSTACSTPTIGPSTASCCRSACERSVDGKPTEEITFDKVKVNGKIDAKKFTVSK